MLWTIILILVVLWVLGLATSAVGNLVHILLVIAVVVLILQLVRGRGVQRYGSEQGAAVPPMMANKQFTTASCSEFYTDSLIAPDI